MFLDASAMIAIVARETDGSAIAALVDQADKVFTSAIAIYEATMGLARIGQTSPVEARAVLEILLQNVDAQIVPLDSKMADAAIAAFSRFGKGRHRAGLNMGDCFAYACAKELDVPLLFKGNDFSQTDIAVA
jgi:ribonuclease VapC